MQTSANVYVVDDEPAILRALTRLLEGAGYNVHSSQSPREFLERYDGDAVDCMIVDFSMPEINGLELQRSISASGHSCPIVFLSGRGDIAVSVDAMKGGAVDFLTKPVDADLLLNAVNTAVSGADQRRSERLELAALKAKYATLTTREQQVFCGVVAGLLNKQIAQQLGTAEKTIKVQRGHMMQKMQAHSLAELVRMATRLTEHTPVARAL